MELPAVLSSEWLGPQSLRLLRDKESTSRTGSSYFQAVSALVLVALGTLRGPG
jgi:hypothetical protein